MRHIIHQPTYSEIADTSARSEPLRLPDGALPIAPDHPDAGKPVCTPIYHDLTASPLLTVRAADGGGWDIEFGTAFRGHCDTKTALLLVIARLLEE